MHRFLQRELYLLRAVQNRQGEDHLGVTLIQSVYPR